ncbi:hypothetical protein [Streptomyces sp. TS71-3]|uniref:hypothetical protein n=1 Tax=Streptomyces sp. TS71-3 TaxID=2733862 RepID=UPI001B15E89F|nr:hypothetical protein [Streptomyces sp. TS71-3]GHJ37968.1 hypothetical protein Sm713_35770 [Streptomyces sp. TS71-3]
MTEASTDATSRPTAWPREADQPTGPGRHRGQVSAHDEEAAPHGRHRKQSGQEDTANAA